MAYMGHNRFYECWASGLWDKEEHELWDSVNSIKCAKKNKEVWKCYKATRYMI